MLKFLVKLEHILPKTSACFFITFTTLPLICYFFFLAEFNLQMQQNSD